MRIAFASQNVVGSNGDEGSSSAGPLTPRGEFVVPLCCTFIELCPFAFPPKRLDLTDNPTLRLSSPRPTLRTGEAGLANGFMGGLHRMGSLSSPGGAPLSSPGAHPALFRLYGCSRPLLLTLASRLARPVLCVSQATAFCLPVRPP